MPDMTVIAIDACYAMFKGEPGVRKSTCALSYPKPQYWFSYDQKMESIALPMRKWGIDPKLIQFDDYSAWEPARQKLEKFRTDIQGYKTIVIDSVTSLADASLRQVLKVKGGSDKGKMIAGIAVNSVEDFNAESSILSEMVALTKDIHKYHKVNVILIAHVIQTESKTLTGETHMSRVIVTAAKKIAAKIPAYCTEVYHFNIDKGFVEGAGGSYALLTEHTGDDFARTALPLDRKIVFGSDPLYDKYILPAINKSKEPIKITTPF